MVERVGSLVGRAVERECQRTMIFNWKVHLEFPQMTADRKNGFTTNITIEQLRE